jgi:hypothetical protein
MQEEKNIEEYIKDTDFEEKSREGWKGKLSSFLNSKYFIPIIIILTAAIAFSLGRISGLQEKRPPVRIISNSGPARLDGVSGGEVKGASVNNSPPNPSLNLREGSPALSESGGQVVASKNGTKYHYPWCAGAKQISAKNLITFNSIEEAKKAGYSPASNCKGLK